ncbi:Rpn family recombination-promoting nuclease/putative transposase [[Phormidium] sp. ETS-05]|uniref:Rpn family recombination-promoting nuclease/putative transposase n=1 Tax=[Phormidium] sp. ETS-05 TaxID=222819 RepID=UPI002106CA93|nr:Rpn family recombination-promoting nuclease/putative transposase [[Phormidium] sp. ETS-05]
MQFQPKPDFYWRLFAEIAIYLNQYQPGNDWRAVAIFAARNLDPGVPIHYRGFLASQQLHQVYLDELETNTTPSLGLGIVRLVVADQASAIDLARSLITTTRESVADAAVGQKIMELLERILIYKFTELPTKEIEAMFTLEDLKKTRVYQEAKAEGKIEGEIKGKLETIPLLLEAGFTVEVIADRLGLDLELVRLVAGGQAQT